MAAIIFTFALIILFGHLIIKKICKADSFSAQTSSVQSGTRSLSDRYTDFSNLSPAQKAMVLETLKEDYSFPNEEILQARIKAGYYDDDPDMLEIHDPDRYDYLYGDDGGDDDYDGEADW